MQLWVPFGLAVAVVVAVVVVKLAVKVIVVSNYVFGLAVETLAVTI